MVHEGSCLCGHTKVKFEGELGPVAICHCKSCQKAGGTAFSVNTLAPEDKVTVKGPVHEFTEEGSETGNRVLRVFCSNCGSPIYTKTPYYAPNIALKTSLFSGFADQELKMELFTKDRSKHLVDLHDAQQFKGMNPV